MNPRAMRGGEGEGVREEPEREGVMRRPLGFLAASIQVPFRYHGGARAEEGETKLAQGIFGDRFVVAQAVELVWISNCVLAVSRPRHSKSIQMEFRTIRERLILQREMGGESVRGFGKE